MNKDDIKKTLEFCADAFPCEGCAYHDDLMCTDKLKTDALNVIIEQEQEIEKWKNDYAKLQEQFAQYQMASDKEIMAQKKQAVKEFAEKLKDYINDKIIEEFFDMAVGIKYFTIDIDEFEERVDELLKEYENDT